MAVGRLPEPAWHRRLRRERSGQRLLLQVSAACVKLVGHHGSNPPEILRPLLNALSKYAPRPCDVPWPGALTSIGSHRSPKTMLMPNSDIAEVAVVSTVASSSHTSVTNLSGGEWRPLPFNSASSSSGGDFRSLPYDHWPKLLWFSDSRRAELSEFFSDISGFVGEFRLRVFTQQKVFHKLWLSSIGLLNIPANPIVWRINTCFDKCFEFLRDTLSICASFESYRSVFKQEFLLASRNFSVVLHSLTEELAAATALLDQVA
jgi:hypothetical protein